MGTHESNRINGLAAPAFSRVLPYLCRLVSRRCPMGRRGNVNRTTERGCTVRHRRAVTASAPPGELERRGCRAVWSTAATPRRDAVPYRRIYTPPGSSPLAGRPACDHRARGRRAGGLPASLGVWQHQPVLPVLLLYPFRFVDPLTGRWVRAVLQAPRGKKRLRNPCIRRIEYYA